MRLRLNRKVLLLLLVGTLLLGGGIHLLHGFQVRRNTPALLAQAEKLEEDNKLEDATFLLRLYLRRAPADADARVRYALLRVKLDRSPRELQEAYQGLEDLLRDQPDREDVRRQAVVLAMLLREHAAARYHLEQLLKAKPNDGELEWLTGECYLAEG